MTERVEALNIDVALAGDKIPPALLAKVRDARLGRREAKDKITRQSVIDDAAYLLFDAGDRAGAKRLVTAELERSDQPYYYMSSLADFAEQEGDKAAAVNGRARPMRRRKARRRGCSGRSCGRRRCSASPPRTRRR